MNKKEALNKLATLEEETAKLRKIIEEPENYIDTIKTYKQVCEELGEEELTLSDFDHLPEYMRKKQLNIAKLQQVEKLFNGTWKANMKDPNQRKYYPYFEIKAGSLVFCDSSYTYADTCFGLVVYFKDELISTYVGKQFVDLYKGLY